MDALDTVSIAILLGSLLVLAGVLSSLLAMRFGAPFRLADSLPEGLSRKEQKAAATDLIMRRIAAQLDERHRGPYA